MTIPHRGATTESTYFVTANVFERKSLFQVDKIARLFIEILMDYRAQKKYLLHEFIVMPDHFHLILTPTGITLERAGQFGGLMQLSCYKLSRQMEAVSQEGNSQLAISNSPNLKHAESPS